MKIKDIIVWLNENGLEYTACGNMEDEVSGFSSLSRYRPGSMTWIKKENNYDAVGRPGNITCAVVQKGVKVGFENVIYSGNSKELFFMILEEFWGERKQERSLGEGTVIAGNVRIHPTAKIGCNCTICGEVTIGENTCMEHNVVVQGRVRIGAGCYIQSQAVIGIDGYGYRMDEVTKKKTMVKHYGGVCIGNDVFIGSHVNIARGTIDDTVIGDGVKIAPSTHIGHNNEVGEDTAVICSALYGSVHTGERSYITASVIENQISVGHDTVIGMGSVVTKPIGDNIIAYGIPAREKKENNSSL